MVLCTDALLTKAVVSRKKLCDRCLMSLNDVHGTGSSPKTTPHEHEEVLIVVGKQYPRAGMLHVPKKSWVSYS